jgi:hypothetical protein
MSTKSKRKQKRSDIEAKDRNKTKTFDVFQNLKWNVSIYSKNFGTKPKLFDVFHLFFSKSKTFLFIPKILEQNQTFLCVPTFFYQKQNVTVYSKKLETKPKRLDLVHKFLETKQNLL